MSETILEAKHLYFSYDNDQTHSLNDFSLKIEKGKKIAVMGSNGSGKSYLFPLLQRNPPPFFRKSVFSRKRNRLFPQRTSGAKE